MDSLKDIYPKASRSTEHATYSGPRRAWSTFRNSPSTLQRRATGGDLLTPQLSRPSLPLNHSGASTPRTMPLTKKKLCEFCQTTIIAADRKWGYHHSKFSALRDSANEGCILCVQLYEDITVPEIEYELSAWPLYRWNIRSPQKGGHEEEIFASIVFRQAISIQRPLPSQLSSRPDLPERTFFLFQQSGNTSLPHSSPHSHLRKRFCTHATY
jgi:hypothetical protein